MLHTEVTTLYTNSLGKVQSGLRLSDLLRSDTEKIRDTHYLLFNT